MEPAGGRPERKPQVRQRLAKVVPADTLGAVRPEDPREAGALNFPSGAKRQVREQPEPTTGPETRDQRALDVDLRSPKEANL
jgi:hypothetical protein